MYYAPVKNFGNFLVKQDAMIKRALIEQWDEEHAALKKENRERHIEARVDFITMLRKMDSEERYNYSFKSLNRIPCPANY